MMHLIKPEPYDKIVPRFRAALSSMCCGPVSPSWPVRGLLLVPRTSRFGAYFTAGLLIVVFPANVKMALDGADPGRRLVHRLGPDVVAAPAGPAAADLVGVELSPAERVGEGGLGASSEWVSNRDGPEFLSGVEIFGPED